MDKVYEAVSRGDHISKWWTKISSGDPKLNAIYRFYFSSEYDWKAKVLSCDGYSEIVFRFIEADHDWMNTEISFRLNVLNGTTKTEFSHAGWTTTNEHFRRSSYCWAMYLQLLKAYVETGKVTPFNERIFI